MKSQLLLFVDSQSIRSDQKVSYYKRKSFQLVVEFDEILRLERSIDSQVALLRYEWVYKKCAKQSLKITYILRDEGISTKKCYQGENSPTPNK